MRSAMARPAASSLALLTRRPEDRRCIEVAARLCELFRLRCAFSEATLVLMPTDCVHLAVTGMLEGLPDMVVSGINIGANMGDDTIYSGTVAAATEGFLLGVPSLAISLCSKEGAHFATAARVARELVELLQKQALSEPVLLNVNVPDVPWGQLRGTVVTRLGKRHKAEPVVRTLSPRNETVFWIGAAGAAQDAGEGTDFHAVQNDQVSVTPLQIDLTHNAQLPLLREWLAR
jgi:5'-nucleotidase